MEFVNALEDIILFDGAMGSQIEERGLAKLGRSPVYLNLDNPTDILEIHKSYVNSGAKVITTNTFEANEFKVSPKDLDQIIKSGIRLAKDSGAEFVAFDVGPLGKLLEPDGDLSFDKAFEAFKNIFQSVSDIDLILLETFSDLLELKCAYLAAREVLGDIPIVSSMTFQSDGYSFTGCSPESFALTMQALGVKALGVNCSLGPKQLKPIVEKILEVTSIPVIVQANAGLPELKGNKTVYPVDIKSYIEAVLPMINGGVSLIGGCCGTTPDYIRALSNLIREIKKVKRNSTNIQAVTTPSRVVKLNKPIIVGERINPSGNKTLKQDLEDLKYDSVLRTAIEEEHAGAKILDVNLTLAESSDKERFERILPEILRVCPLPLQIDSTDPEVLDFVLARYPGIPIVNSVNASIKSIKTIFPLVKKYGAYVICLLLDEDGIAKTKDKKLKLAKKIVNEASNYGIKSDQLIFDPLCLTIASNPEGAKESLEALHELSKDYLTTMGISNISFGLPNRNEINANFLLLALKEGLKLAMVNPQDKFIQENFNLFNIIYHHNPVSLLLEESKPEVKDVNLKEAIILGLSNEALNETKEKLKKMSAQEIINLELIPALSEVSDRYDKKEIFLPQLLQSAQAVKQSFDYLKTNQTQQSIKDKGTIIMATVEGDIHDIGKNIVSMMLENFGYRVYDLGADISAKDIIKIAKEKKALLIGLSALMTSTVDSMKKTIAEIKKELPETKIMVGGAVLTSNLAQSIQADYFGEDASSAVNIADKFFKE